MKYSTLEAREELVKIMRDRHIQRELHRTVDTNVCIPVRWTETIDAHAKAIIVLGGPLLFILVAIVTGV